MIPTRGCSIHAGFVRLANATSTARSAPSRPAKRSDVKERRVAIITGASSGIGRALAERAVRAGYDVVAVGRRAERLDALAALLESATGRIQTLALDLREPGAASRIVGAARDHFGRIDVLVNCAGGTAIGRITEQPDAALYEQFETHVIVPLALTREALPSLRATRGLLIYFGSGVARVPVGMLGAYPPAKAAVRNLTRVARNELKADGVAVTYVDPGAVATEFMTRVGFAGPPASIAASPYDVARAVFGAFTSRAPIVNAVPWQTLFVAIGEALPRLTDSLLARAPALLGTDPVLGNPTEIALPAAHPPVLPDRVGPQPATRPEIPEPPVEPAPAVNEPSGDVAASERPVIGEAPHAYDAANAAVDSVLEEARAADPSTFEGVLAPHAARMKKLNLKQRFVRELLRPDTELELGYVAMRWAGMPNKHERGLTGEVLETLADAGYLQRLAGEKYRVLRGADSEATA